jgi:hypothetical protein
MRIISADRTFIDYFQKVSSIHTGLKNLFGIRVLEGRCVAVVKTGDGQPGALGKTYSLPVEVERLPSYLQLMVEDYVLHYPGSELTDVLAGRKSFQEALNSPPEMEDAAFRAPGDGSRTVRSAGR